VKRYLRAIDWLAGVCENEEHFLLREEYVKLLWVHHLLINRFDCAGGLRSHRRRSLAGHLALSDLNSFILFDFFFLLFVSVDDGACFSAAHDSELDCGAADFAHINFIIMIF
jgi:hypothetical protein